MELLEFELSDKYRCDECEIVVCKLVEFYHVDPSEIMVTRLCVECIKKALKLIQK